MTELFDRTAKAIIAMNEDLEKLSDRYGKVSKFVIDKKNQVETIANFYDEIVDVINDLKHENTHLKFQVKILKLVSYKQEMNVPYKQAFELSGINSPDESLSKLLDLDLPSSVTTNSNGQN